MSTDIDIAKYIEVGHWDPYVLSGKVHDHPEKPTGNWSVTMHRSCEPVYIKRLPLICDNCGQPVRVADGLHSGGYRHDDDDSTAAAEWCETEDGTVRVTVGGHQRVSE